MSSHVVPTRVYYLVFLALVVGTMLTVWISFFNLGFFNPIVAVGIAVIKATLVVLFFMHVKYSSRLTWVVVCAGFFWLGILIALGMSDYLSRDWLGVPGR